MPFELDRRDKRPLSMSRVLDEVYQHPVVTGVAVVGIALTLGALLHYGPPIGTRSRHSLFERIRRSVQSLTD
ncbi:hypothetical protein GCM10028792_18890 [Salinisphaera aquimarina]